MRRFFSNRFGRAASDEPRTTSSKPAHVAIQAKLRTGWRARPLRLIVICGLLTLSIVAVGAGFLLLQFRDQTLAEHERELQKLALTLAEQADRSFQAVEVVQKSIVTRMQMLGIASVRDFEQQMSSDNIHLMLKDTISGLPHVEAVMLISSQGKLINFSQRWPVPDVDVSNQDYFKTLKSVGEMMFFLSEPIRDRETGAWTVYVARKFSGPNGEFLGLVLGAVDLWYFEEFYNKVALGSDGTIALIRRDGMLLARYPHSEKMIGKSLAANPSFADLIAKADVGAARLTSIVDGQDRLFAAHTLGNYPIVVSVSTTVADALARWRKGALYAAGLSFLFLLVAGSMIVLCAWVVQQNLRTQNLQIEAALGNMSQGLCMFDSRGTLIVHNARYLEIINASPGSVKPGHTIEQLLQRHVEAGMRCGDPAKEAMAITAAIARGETSHIIMEFDDGRTISVTNRPMAGGGWVATLEDITERLRLERERDRHQAFLNAIVENVPTAITVKSARDRRFVLVNRAYEELRGVSRDQVLGNTPSDIYSPESHIIPDVDEDVLPDRIYSHERSVEIPGKGTRIVRVKRLFIRENGGQPRYQLAVIDDVTEQRRSEQRIAHMARYDALTDLPNRALFCDELDRALARVHHGERLALLFLDLDHFKRVNDTLGHPIGDELLKSAADRLRGCVRDIDLITRLGGDEFAVIQTALDQPSDAAALAMRISDALKAPYDIDGQKAVVDVSIGIAIAPDDAVERNQLLKNADMALYSAKGGGRGTYCFYEPEMDARMKRRQQLELDLQHALGNGEFELYYQPIVNLGSNEVTGCEALVRWNHPERGLVGPNEFIPIAEESGLITCLGEWVLRQACADAAAWPDDIKVAVNLSPAQLKGGKLVEVVVSALAESGLPASRLGFEITEMVLMQNTSATLSTLHQLHELGIQISLDDFGTGYSSLSYLQSFPFDKIKIDQSFVETILENDNCVAIIEAITNMARRLNTTTVAEGIETEEQRAKVLELGCTEMQGYLFSRPRPVADIVRLFLRRAGTAASAA